MMMTQEQAVLKGQVHLAEMAKFISQAAKGGRPIEEAERGLWQPLLELGRTMLAGYVETVGPGDVGETLTHEGRVLRRLESTRDRRYVSVFGELAIPRYVYGTRETQKPEVVPTAARLGLPEGAFSNLLSDWERAWWRALVGVIAGVVCILDLFHVLERLWQAAHCFYAEGSEAAQAFVTDRLRRLLRGEVGYVIGGLKQMATKQKLRGSRKRHLSAVIGYLEGNRRFMRYDEYLAAGYPIGSGVAEGACRHLVKDRMELTGMHWRVPGAQAMLDLRAVSINGDWDAFQQHRVKQEHRRLYPYLSLVRRKHKKPA